MNITKLTSPKEFDILRKRLYRQRAEKKTIISICAGTGCLACGCEKVADAFYKAIWESRLQNEVEVKTTGCPGFCECGPIVVIYPEGIFYQQVSPEDAKLVVEQTIKGGQLVKRLLYQDPKTKETIPYEKDIPFYKKQMRLLLGKNMEIDPTSIYDYIASEGYQMMIKTIFGMSPEEVINEIVKSGLRGRGGGGYPAGKKWNSCRNAKGEPKYVICNAHEGDPGAFMDRAILHGNPHLVIEGMIIGAFAIGSHQGYVYLHHECPPALKNIIIAVKQARDLGLLGDNILGSGFEFNIEVSRGGAAYVCSESTALMTSLEGKIGEPRAKYVHTVEFGLWDKPSNLNNVETWANVPLIMEKGADWYASIGTPGSKGTKVFALSGRILHTGLVEVPMGTTLREILYDIGGGIKGNKKFKAVQTGGPLGGMLVVETKEPEIHQSLVAHGDIREEQEERSLLDVPVDFDELTKAGSMIGSGGMIVLDEDSCMVEIAKYFINFLRDESCCKCIPCREGLRIMLEILNRICEGKVK